MRRLILTLSGIVLCLGCFVGTGFAANYTDRSIGISIDLDDKLTRQSNWRGYIVFSAADNSASVFIKPLYELSLYHLREDLKGEGGGFDDVGSIDLVVTGDEKNAQVSSGSGVLVPVKGRIGEYKVRGVFGGFSGFDDQNFLIIAAARPDYWNDWMPGFQSMLENIKFIKVDYTEMMNTWYNRLTGKTLVADIPADQSHLGPKPFNLCSNGIVAEEQPANPQPATPQQQTIWNGFAWVTVPVVPMPRPPARWLIEPYRGKPTLVIRQGPGPRPLEFRLEMEGDQLMMNGKPYRIAENTLCKSEPGKR
jgi:hypothetical protein